MQTTVALESQRCFLFLAKHIKLGRAPCSPSLEGPWAQDLTSQEEEVTQRAVKVSAPVRCKTVMLSSKRANAGDSTRHHWTDIHAPSDPGL